jgi:hypothetical protein
MDVRLFAGLWEGALDRIGWVLEIGGVLVCWWVGCEYMIRCDV